MKIGVITKNPGKIKIIEHVFPKRSWRVSSSKERIPVRAKSYEELAKYIKKI